MVWTKKRYERGVVLVLVMFLIVITGVMAMGLMARARINLSLASNLAGYKKARYAAEGGIDYGKAILAELNNLADFEEIYREINLRNNSRITININREEKTETKTVFIIKSHGYYGNCEESITTKVVISN